MAIGGRGKADGGTQYLGAPQIGGMQLGLLGCVVKYLGGRKSKKAATPIDAV